MPDDPSTIHDIPRPADNDFINGWPAAMRAAIDLIDGVMATAIDDDPRPAAGTFGRIHRHPTTGAVSFDAGTGWVEIAKVPVPAASLAADVVLPPITTILAYGGVNLPANGKWGWCDGGSYAESEVPAFVVAVGGAASPWGRFFDDGIDEWRYRVPDLRGRVPVGVDGTAGRLDANDTLGASGGAQKHTLTTPEMPSHSHPPSGGGGSFWVEGNTGFQSNKLGGTADEIFRTASTASVGGGGAHNNMQPYLVVNHIIRVL
jgi:microcystin-dependent protein